MPTTKPTSTPLDAATAFAELYRRWFSDPRALLRESERRAAGLVGAYLADVLALWDDRASAWLPRTPTILRLESCDVAVFAMRDPFVAPCFEGIDTDSPVATFGARAKGRAGAPRWRNLRPCSYAIGRTLERIVFDTDGDGRILAVRAQLDDGAALHVDATGVACADQSVPRSA